MATQPLKLILVCEACHSALASFRAWEEQICFSCSNMVLGALTLDLERRLAKEETMETTNIQQETLDDAIALLGLE